MGVGGKIWYRAGDEVRYVKHTSLAGISTLVLVILELATLKRHQTNESGLLSSIGNLVGLE